MKTHRPFIKDGVYHKVEKDDHCLYRKGRDGISLSIRAEVLEKSDRVQVNVAHRNAIVTATKEEIKSHKEVKTFFGEVKYYYPAKKWKLIEGETNWYEEV
jgi:hypothetical protein